MNSILGHIAADSVERKAILNQLMCPTVHCIHFQLNDSQLHNTEKSESVFRLFCFNQFVTPTTRQMKQKSNENF